MQARWKGTPPVRQYQALLWHRLQLLQPRTGTMARVGMLATRQLLLKPPQCRLISLQMKRAAFAVTCMGPHGRAQMMVQDCTGIFVHFARLEMHIMFACYIQLNQT